MNEFDDKEELKIESEELKKSTCHLDEIEKSINSLLFAGSRLALMSR